MQSSVFPPRFRTGLDGLTPGPTSADVLNQRILRADGSWVGQPTGTVPSVTGQAGRFLWTDGASASWSPGLTFDAGTGILTSSTVSGALQLTRTAGLESPRLTLSDGTTTSLVGQAGSAGALTLGSVVGDLVVRAPATKAVRVTVDGGTTTAATFAATSGNLLLGTTTDDGVNRLQVSGSVGLTGTLTTTGGNISVSRTGAADATATLSADAGRTKNLLLSTAGVRRWALQSNGTAESGGNAGSNFLLLAYSDADALLGAWLSVTRATGVVTLASAAASTTTTTGALVVPNGGVGIGGALTVGGAISGGSGLTLNAGGIGDQNITLVSTGTGSVNITAAAGSRRGLVIGGASAANNFPLRVLYDSNAGVFLEHANLDAGTQAAANIAVVSNGGSGGMRMHSAAHAIWPDTFFVGSDSAASGGMALATGAGPIVFFPLNTERVRVSDAGLRVGTGGTHTDLIVSATAVLDFPSINVGASSDLTVTVTGASAGDSVHLGLPSTPTAGIVFNAFVSATNTVTVRAFNVTGSPLDPGSATYRVTVMSF